MTVTPPRTLLATWFAPDDRKGGAVIVRSLAERFPADRLRWYTFSHPAGPLIAPFAAQFSGCCVATNRGASRLGLGRFWKWHRRAIWPHSAARRVVEVARAWQPEVVWIVLDYLTVPVAANLVRRLPGQRFHFSIHDDPQHTASREGESHAALRGCRAALETLRTSNASLDAVSEELLASAGWPVERQAVVTLGCDPAASVAQISPPRAEGPLTIGVAGNYLGVAELRVALAGLDIWQQAAGRPWRIVVVGRPDLAGIHPYVETVAYRHADTVRQILASADVLYIPLGLRAEDREQMRTSLPTKLVSYAELGKLVLAHAPHDSATARVLRDHALGVALDSHDPAEVAQAIDRLLQWDLPSANAGRQRLLDDRFAPQAIATRFFNAIASPVGDTGPGEATLAADATMLGG